MCIYIYIHIHTHTNTYTHIYIYISSTYGTHLHTVCKQTQRISSSKIGDMMEYNGISLSLYIYIYTHINTQNIQLHISNGQVTWLRGIFIHTIIGKLIQWQCKYLGRNHLWDHPQVWIDHPAWLNLSFLHVQIGGRYIQGLSRLLQHGSRSWSSSLQDLPWTCFSILFSDRTRGSTVPPWHGSFIIPSDEV